jgi:hypothetical protein
MSDFFRRILLTFDNLVAVMAALFAVVLAAISVLSDQMSTAAMLEGVITVLAFLLVTLVIERETRLKSLSADISGLRADYLRYHKPFLKGRDDLGSFADYIKDADELFYTGGHASSLLTSEYNTLKKWLTVGRKFKIIIQDPNNHGLRHLAMPCSNYTQESYRRQIDLTITRLKELSCQVAGQIEVRLTNITPSNSVTILDGHKGGHTITILMHVPDGDAGTSPFMRITQTDNPSWHRLFYERYYELLWSKSVPNE